MVLLCVDAEALVHATARVRPGEGGKGVAVVADEGVAVELVHARVSLRPVLPMLRTVLRTVLLLLLR